MEFVCKKCGSCCKKFGEYHFLPVFEWEREDLEREAELKNITLNFQPIGLILDKRSNSAICMQFGMKNEPCPFLSKENQCSIYERRPLVCRSFPLHDSPILKEEPNFNLSSFIHCENFDTKKLLIEHFGLKEGEPKKFKKSDITKKYLSAYGYESLIAVTQKAMIEHISKNMIKELIDKKLVKFRRISKSDYKKYKPIPLFEFLEKIKAISPEAKEETIKRLTNKEDTKKNINQVINNI